MSVPKSNVLSCSRSFLAKTDLGYCSAKQSQNVNVVVSPQMCHYEAPPNNVSSNIPAPNPYDTPEVKERSIDTANDTLNNMELDDFANHALLRSKETDLSRLLKKLRHFHINVMICVQTTKSIPKDLKRTVSDIVLFPGISQYDFEDLIRESPAAVFDYKKLWNEYNKLKDPHATFTIHIKAKKIIISTGMKTG